MKRFYVERMAIALVGCGWLFAAFSGCGSSTADEKTAIAGASASASKASPLKGATTSLADAEKEIPALRRAADAGKYLFAFFWKEDNESTRAMRKVFDEATGKVTDRAQAIVVKITDEAAKPLVEKFELAHAPMPLVLAIAPNGAVMGGFPKEFTEEALLGAFGSPCTEKCMKKMQDGKLVLLCVQNESTALRDEAMKGVKEFAADERYASATEIVILDPADARETPFLDGLKIDPKTTQAVTAFMAPPGSVIAEFEGATDKEGLISALQKANTGCGPEGCGPGGCGPQK
jgi:hypothetical protein